MIIDELRTKFPNMPNLRVRSILVDKARKKVTCVISYPNLPTLDKAITANIRAVAVANIPSGYRYDVQLADDKFNEKTFLTFLLDLIKKKFPIFSEIKPDNIEVKVNDFNIAVNFRVGKITKHNIENSGFLQDLQNFLRGYTCYKVTFSVSVNELDTVQQVDIDAQERIVQLAVNRALMRPQRYFNVADVKRCYGKEINGMPMYISDIRNQMDSCIICGKITEKSLKPSKSNPMMQLCKFNLTDQSGSTFPCIVFAKLAIEDVEIIKQSMNKSEVDALNLSKHRHAANDKKLKALTFLSANSEVLVRGRVVYSDFSDRLEMQVSDICICRLLPIDMQPKFERSTPTEYTLVHPTSLKEYRQMTLEDQPAENSTDNKTYAVVSVNVTGRNVVKDKIYSICCVKIANGHLQEKLFSFVQPEISLTEQQLKRANVTERQIFVSPTITEIIPDLYKFLVNVTLIGNDLHSVVDMLNYYATPLGFRFQNNIENQTELLSALFDKGNFKSKPNCSNVSDVVKALKLDCKVDDSSESVAMAVAHCISVLSHE